MQKGSDIVKDLIASKSNDILVSYKNHFKVRMVKYTCDDIDKEHGNVKKNKKYEKAKKEDQKRNPEKVERGVYYIATSNLTSSMKEIMDFYHERWHIETFFRFAKYDMSMNNIRSKSYQTLQQDLYANQFISIISFYIKYILTEENIKEPLSEQINTHTCIDVVVSNLMKILLLKFNKHSKKYWAAKMAEILKIVTKITVTVVLMRYFRRIRRKPAGKWNVNGTTSGRPKVKKKLIKQAAAKCKQKVNSVEKVSDNNEQTVNNIKKADDIQQKKNKKNKK